VLVITRALADAIGYLFDAIDRGRLRLPLVHPDTASATRRIVRLLVWGVGIAVAYPHLPGASSEAFKGLSVLLGLMITLGSAGLVNQAMSGLVVVYSRALSKGDFVELNDVQGVVTEVAALSTKIVNVRNEEITIPNSVLISSPIRNFSRLSGAAGALLSAKVTIGYDAPWRQVHALLIEAARKTSAVRATPAPFVYQRALSDFYVEYERESRSCPRYMPTSRTRSTSTVCRSCHRTSSPSRRMRWWCRRISGMHRLPSRRPERICIPPARAFRNRRRRLRHHQGIAYRPAMWPHG